MDPRIVESELRSHKIRQGPIYKRTKFLQQWNERWMVLTMNFIFVFTNRNMKELIEFLDLRDVTSYKSYMKKDDDMIPSGFKIQTVDDMYYFCARNCNEKWSWMVSIQRLMDFKYAGKSPYNNSEYITTRGFMSQGQFQRGKFDVADKVPEVPKPEIKVEATSKVNQKDLQKIQQELEIQLAKLKQKEEDMAHKQKEQEEIFLNELNKLKKAEEALKEVQLQVEERAKQVEKILNEHKQQLQKQPPVQIIVEKNIEKPAEQPAEQPAEKPIQVIAVEPVTAITQTKIQKPQVKQQKIEVKVQQISAPPPSNIKKQSKSNKISQLKKFYETKIQQDVKVARSNTGVNISTLKSFNKPSTKQQNNKDEFLHLCRNKVVVNLFQEFHSKAYTYNGLKYIIDFMIKMAAERSLGYQQFVVYECKTNQNRFLFAEVMLEYINSYKEYKLGDKLCKVIQLLIFEAPGIFKTNHFDLIKRKLTDLFNNIQEDPELGIVLKTMYVVHKLKHYEKDEDLKVKLNDVINSKKSEESKNWARKLYEDIWTQ